MTRAPLKLTREAKLLLLLLLMVGLIGLWYVWTNNRAAEDLASQPPATPVTGGGNPDAVPVVTDTPVAQAPSDADASPDGALSVQPETQVQVEEIPPFPTGEPEAAPTAGAAPAAPAEPEVPTGINPDGVVGAAPAGNPFRPLALAKDSGTPSTPAPSPAPVTPAPTPEIVSARPLPAPASAAGPLSFNEIPGTGTTTVTGGGPSGSVLPIPQIPGADGEGQAPVTPIIPTAPAEPGPAVVQVPAPRPQGGAGPAAEPAPRTPRPAPIAGVRVPEVASALPTPAAPAAGAPITALPTPGTPQVISELAPSGEAATTTQNPLERYLRDQSLAFEAAVLGPVNTAIFRGRDGYVVVATGQTLPDSAVLLKEVTATGATLALGNDSTTLELDKR